MWKILVFIVLLTILCLLYSSAEEFGVDPNLLLLILAVIAIAVIIKL